YDFGTLARDYPATASYLSGLENARIAHDDIDSMGLVEKSARFLANSGKALASAVPQFNAAIWRQGQAAAEFLAPLAQPLAGRILPENPFARAAQGFRGMAQQQEGLVRELMPRAEGDISAGYSSGLQSLGLSAQAIAVALATRNPAAALAIMSGTTGGSAYGQAREQGVDPMQALAFA